MVLNLLFDVKKVSLLRVKDYFRFLELHLHEQICLDLLSKPFCFLRQ